MLYKCLLNSMLISCMIFIMMALSIKKAINIIKREKPRKDRQSNSSSSMKRDYMAHKSWKTYYKTMGGRTEGVASVVEAQTSMK